MPAQGYRRHPSRYRLRTQIILSWPRIQGLKRFELHFQRARIFNWIRQLMDIGPNLFYSPTFLPPLPVGAFGNFNLRISSISALICAHISTHFGSSSSADNPSSRESNLDISQQIDCTGIPLLLQPIWPIDCYYWFHELEAYREMGINLHGPLSVASSACECADWLWWMRSLLFSKLTERIPFLFCCALPELHATYDVSKMVMDFIGIVVNWRRSGREKNCHPPTLEL